MSKTGKFDKESIALQVAVANVIAGDYSQNSRCKKDFYATEAAAQYYIDKFNRTKSPKNKTKLRAYMCPKCFTWHLTSKKSLNDIADENTQARINNLKEKVERQKIQIKHLEEAIANLKNKKWYRALPQ